MAADDYQIISKHGKTTAASAVSPSSIKKPKERVPAKPDMPEVNRYLMCQLCSGYLIDATAIIECQHTFCKSCILKYLETNTYCPICDVQLNKAKPQYSLRSDVIIQRLVYKLVPGLLVSESRRRRDFYIKNDMEPVAAAELAAGSLALEIEAVSDMSTVLSLDDVVSLSIEYFRSDDKTSTTTSDGKQQQSTTQSSQNQHQKSNAKSSSVNSSSVGTSTIPATNAPSVDSNNGGDNSEQANDRRYLQCPAAVCVGVLKKLIRRKYDLSDDYRVDLLYNGNRDTILESNLTLLDVAFIYKWNKVLPMDLQYRIYDKLPKTTTVHAGMKRPAPSVMDEPPDDDASSGRHNRSSMFSSSSAPSSKVPRTNTSSQGSQGSVPKDNTSGKSKSTATSSDPAPTSTSDTLSCKSSAVSSSTPTTVKVEKEEVDEDNEDDEDEEDYELVERKEHMKGIKSSRRHTIKESMKRSVAASHLRKHISRSSSSSHSTDTKDSVESERESGNENSLSSSKQTTNANLDKKRRGRGRPPKSIDNTGSKHQRSGSLKMSISTSGITPVVSSSSGVEKKEPLKLSLGTVLGNKGSKSLDRKHHKRKHHHHKLRHREKQSKEGSSSSSSSSSSASPPSNQKPIKLSFTLSPPGTATVHQTQVNQSSKSESGNNVTLIKPSQQESGCEQKGKPLAGTLQNFNNSARTSASAHGHLNNISKSISVSVNTNVNSTKPANSCIQLSGNATKGNHHGNRISPAELIAKNTGIEIQPTTIPIPSTHGQISQQQQQNFIQNFSANNSSNSHKNSHPLLSDNFHVPKSVTLIPVNNPNNNAMSLSGISNSSGSGGSSSLEKRGSGSQTFTHPITNKSLSQITVTEILPPPKKSSGAGMGNSLQEYKLQFNGPPGSMEITKIYQPNLTKENPAKKLKDRKGLDISITGTGINVNVNQTSQKLEETLRQKVNIATCGGSSSISVTPVAAPNSLGSGGYNVITTSSSGIQMNKMKSVSATAASLLSGKMPPGITIGPATVSQNASNNSGNAANNTSNNHAGSGSLSAHVGNNIMKGMGFTLPPHLTAHPHNPNNMKNMSSQGKSDKMSTSSIQTNNSRQMNKDTVSMIGKGNTGVAGEHKPPHQPPPVEITINSTGCGNKSQANIANRGPGMPHKPKMSGDPLSSIFDATQRMRKSPSPVVNNTKDNHVKLQNSVQTLNAAAQPINTKNILNKRSHETSASSNSAQSGNKKATNDSPEMKRGRSASTSSDSGTSAKKPPGIEIPLDLSGRSTRTTPPLTIPQICDSSKSPAAPTTAMLNEKRALSRSLESEKIGPMVISNPSATSSSTSNCKNFPSPKMNTPKNSAAVDPSNKVQQQQQQLSKSISVSKLSPNQASSKIGSIVDSLAQKQAQAQQNLQTVKNSSQQLHHSHHHHNSSNVASNQNSSMNSSTTGGFSIRNDIEMTPSSNKVSTPSANITSPSTMTSPVMPLTSPSPTGTDHIRNLWTLSDAAVRQGKINSMNELLVAASLFSPPGNPHSMAHQFAAAAAANASGAGASAFNSNIMAQFGHHLAALGANKLPPGMMDHHFMAALHAHNAHAAAAGMRMSNQFAGTMSPPLNAFFPHGAAPAPKQPSLIGLSAPGHPPKITNPSNSTHKPAGSGAVKPNSLPFAPFFSQSVPVSSPKSPNAGNLSGSSGPSLAKAPATSNSIPPPVLLFTGSASCSLSNHVGSSSNSKDQKPLISNMEKNINSINLQGSNKSTKINGTISTAMPVFPPGIHNPLRSSASSGNSPNASSLRKSFSSGVGNASKGEIPNSMKISNFLPSKPNHSTSNAEATITSGSNFGIPPLQSKPNFSSSPSRSPSDSSSLNNSAKCPSMKEGPLSPVKSLAASMTCASLLLPDSMYSKPSTHHLLNSLSPTKGDHQENSGLCRSNRTLASDFALLSPNSVSPTAAHNANRTTSPRASSPFAFNRSPTRSDELADKPQQIDSPTKGEVKSKKEKVSIPMEASLGRNFFPSTTSSALHNTQSLSLTRPIPTISTFFNQSASTATSACPPMSSTASVAHHHLPHHKSLSPGGNPTSPVKTVCDLHQHLASPVFPFPGVSVPVQVKLQDENEGATESVALNSIPTSTSPTISLKSEVNKVIAAKEEKVQEKRKRSCSPPAADHNLSKSNPTSSSPASELKVELMKENVNEFPPTKILKVGTLPTPPLSVKGELQNRESPIISESERKCSNPTRESVNTSDRTARSESIERKESESQASQQGGEQKQEEEREGAAPSKEFSNESITSTTTATTLPTSSPCTVEAKISSPVPEKTEQAQAVEVALSEVQTGDELETPAKDENTSNLISVEKKKSETQILVDTPEPKSNETSAQVIQQESKSLPPPFGEKPNGQIIKMHCVEGKNSEKAEDEHDIDIEMVNVQTESQSSPMGQSETSEIVEMDVVEDNQMEVDVDLNEEEKMDAGPEKILIEERLTITKEDEDLDVDIVDVGIDEPMEMIANGIVNSVENERMEAETIKKLDEAEEICIDNVESSSSVNPIIVSSEQENQEGSNLQLIDFPKSPSVALDNDSEEIEPREANIVEEEGEPKDFKENHESETERQQLDEETEELQNDSTAATEKNFLFLPENDSTNFSQDDSECGDLIIDLDPSEEELQEQEKDKKEEEARDYDGDEVQDVSSPTQAAEPFDSEVSLEIFAEECNEEDSRSLESPTKNIAVNESSFTSPINSPDETIQDGKSERIEKESISTLAATYASPQDDDNAYVDSSNVGDACAESLDQNPNQMEINPFAVEVNGTIKPEEISQEREESKISTLLQAAPVVSECPHTLDSANEKGEDERQEEHAEVFQSLRVGLVGMLLLTFARKKMKLGNPTHKPLKLRTLPR